MGAALIDDFFLGDFDADGEIDVLVIAGGKVHLHRTGKPVETTDLEYPARRAIVVFNKGTTLTEHDGEGGADLTIEVKGASLAMDVREASSAALIRQGDAWKVVWQGGG